MASILMVDAEPVAVAGVRAHFSAVPSSKFSVLSEVAFNCLAALRLVQNHQPEIVLVDSRLGRGLVSGCEVAEAVHDRFPSTQIVFFSNTYDPTTVAMALACGAAAYLPKSTPLAYLQEVLEAVLRPAETRPVLRNDLLRRVREDMQRTDKIPVAGLSVRESQIARCVGYGLSNRQIAAFLNISIETVKEHVQNTLSKLKATGETFYDRTTIAVFVVRNGFVAKEIRGF